jgi:dethiobiotin synthetase
MSRRYIIAGTGTDVGKTVFAAGLAGLISATYWKPIQSGLDGGTDLETVKRLSALPESNFIPEQYRLNLPASPHLAAERDGITIDPEKLKAPATDKPLLIELAGGLMVPITRQLLQIDLAKTWNAPVILVSLTCLGTLNHTLLSLEALRARNIPIHGVAFSGPEHPDNQRTIAEIGNVKVLGRLPQLDSLNATTLSAAMQQNFKREDFI